MPRYSTVLWTSLLLGCAPTTPQKVAIDTGSGSSGGGGEGGLGVKDLRAVPHDEMGSILVVQWHQEAAGESWLEYSFDEDVWLRSPPESRPEGDAEALALGIPFGTAARVRLAWDGGVSAEIVAETGALPDGAPQATRVEGDPAGWDADSPWVLTCMSGETASVDGSWSVIVDRQGRVVWARAGELERISLQTQLSYDGTQILIDQNSFWGALDRGVNSRIERVSLTGAVVEGYDTPRLHHPFTELADGTLAWGAIARNYLDETLELLHPDGSQETLWSCAAFLRERDQTQGNYCGSNTLSWDPIADVFLYSFYSFETVIEIDARSGQTRRYFGHIDAGAWSFDPLESAFWWQHGVHYTADGTLLVSSKDRDDGDETVFREYRLDEAAETLVEVRSFGQNQGVYADVMGEADYTVGGHVLHNYGDAARLREVNPAGDVVWDISWEAEYIGRSTPLTGLYALSP